MTEPTNRRRQRRSRDERVLAGVCGGLAEYFRLDPTVVRVGVVLSALFPPLSAVGVFGYAALAVILPEEGSEHLAGRERVRRNIEGLRTDVGELAGTVRGGLTRGSRDRRSPAGLHVGPPTGSDHPASESAIDRAATGAPGRPGA